MSLSISPVFSPTCNALLQRVATSGTDDAYTLLCTNIGTLCAEISASLNAPWQIDGFVLLCAYFSRHNSLTYTAAIDGVELFVQKINWTMDAFTVAGRAHMSHDMRLSLYAAFLEPKYELVLIKALNSLRVITSTRPNGATGLALDVFSSIENIENMLIGLEAD